MRARHDEAIADIVILSLAMVLGTVLHFTWRPFEHLPPYAVASIGVGGFALSVWARARALRRGGARG